MCWTPPHPTHEPMTRSPIRTCALRGGRSWTHRGRERELLPTCSPRSSKRNPLRSRTPTGRRSRRDHDRVRPACWLRLFCDQRVGRGFKSIFFYRVSNRATVKRLDACHLQKERRSTVKAEFELYVEDYNISSPNSSIDYFFRHAINCSDVDFLRPFSAFGWSSDPS